MVIELTKGVALLLALSLLQSFVLRLWHGQIIFQRAASGLLFGLICIIGMLAPIHFSSGVIFDARSVILAMAGLFGGPVVGAIAAAIAGAYRYALGGVGVWVGVGVIVTSVLLGVIYKYARDRWRVSTGPLALLAFGFILHAVCIAWFMLLPADIAAKILSGVAVPFVLVFTPATAILGWLLGDAERRLETEQKLRAATQALTQSEERFRTVVDHSPIGINLKDADGRVLLANTTYALWLNLDKAAVVGRNIAEFFPADQARSIVEGDRRVLEEDQPLAHEVTRDFADGVRRILAVYKVPIALMSTDSDVVLTIMTDVTGAKLAEEQLLKARDEAVSANRAKSEFLATMSHEFRTPLNAILGFSEILNNQYFGPLGTDKYCEYAGDIHASAMHLLELVNDILDIAAIEDGRIRLDLQDINLAGLIDECARTILDKRNAKGIELMIALPDDLPLLHADRRAVKQVVLNLLSNSIKFTQRGGNITVSAHRVHNGMEIAVTDSGIGIPANRIGELMSPFTKIEDDPYKTSEGWGLGLSIVKSLIELHGGTLHIESELGAGTKITVMLPDAAIGPAEAHP